MDNYEFAREFEKRVKEELISCVCTDQEAMYIDTIFERLLAIEPREAENGLINIDMTPHYSDEVSGISHKISNVKLYLQEAIFLAVETALTFKIPKNPCDLINIALSALLKLYIVSGVKLSDSECKLLLYLHNNNAYQHSIAEEQILRDIEDGNLDLTYEKYNRALNSLIRIASIVVVNNSITLNERVILRYS